MAVYIIRRLLWLPVILLVVSFLTFSIARFGPGDPVTVAAGQSRDPEVMAQVRAERGLDGSVFEQYGRWLSGVVRGDFGDSFIQQGFTVSELIFPKMWISSQLGILAIFIVFGLGIPLGLLAAWANGTWIDPFVISALLFLRAIPVLVIVPPLLWLFAIQLDWLPVGGWDGLFTVWWIGGVIAVPGNSKKNRSPVTSEVLAGSVSAWTTSWRARKIWLSHWRRQACALRRRCRGRPWSASRYRTPGLRPSRCAP